MAVWSSCSAQTTDHFQTEEYQRKPKLSPIGNESRQPPKMNQRAVPGASFINYYELIATLNTDQVTANH